MTTGAGSASPGKARQGRGVSPCSWPGGSTPTTPSPRRRSARRSAWIPKPSTPGAKAAGAVDGRSVLRIRPREDAVRAAILAAQPGDVVLLAGKGHENTILGPNGHEVPWNEREVAVEALRELGFSTP